MEKQEILISLIVGVVIMLFLAMVFIMSIIRYNKKTYAHMKEKISMQSKFQHAILQSQLEMQEQTFNTISQEIHDNVGQILSLAKVQLNIIHQSESLDKELLLDAKDNLSKAMTELRDIAKSLNSDRMKLSSLLEITDNELKRINRSGLMNTSIHVDGHKRNILEQKKLIIFRIIQEALHNILKHSLAKNIDVVFCYRTDELLIEIKDNGRGFDMKKISMKDGLGLKNMISRASLIGGEAKINSVINKGTVITIISPYD